MVLCNQIQTLPNTTLYFQRTSMSLAELMNNHLKRFTGEKKSLALHIIPYIGCQGKKKNQTPGL